jgi:hypothetical protein
MIADNIQQGETQTIEESTLYALGETEQGLEVLADNARNCAQAFKDHRLQEGIEKLGHLVETLHDFDVFEYSMCSVFNVDRHSYTNANSNLEDIASKFRNALILLNTELSSQNFIGLSELLNNDLAESLDRYREFIPMLENELYKQHNTGKDNSS